MTFSFFFYFQDTLKRKAEYLADSDNNVNPERKRQKTTINANEQLNTLIIQWLNDANTRKISVSGPLIQQRALKFAADLGLSEFKASNGWLDKFLKRNNIVFKKMSGERGDVDSKCVSDWKDKIPSVCEGYQPRDIFNMDETGIFFRDGKRTTFVPSGSDCAGGKRSKNRITVALCASMTGEKLKPLVIGKSSKPRCFNRIETASLPVTYRNNKKSWMNSKLFEEWVRSMDRRMRGQGRKVLLLVDNAPSHPQLNLKNVKIVFLPPNTTSVAQQMDQGIIQAVKLKFYRYQTEHILTQMEKSSKCGSDLLKDVNVLNAIYWVSRAWREVDVSTIVKCFDKCGFDKLKDIEQSDDVEESDEDDNIPLALLVRSKEIYGRNLKDIVAEDHNLAVCDTSEINWDLPASELIQNQTENDDESDSDDEKNQNETENICSLSEVNQYIDSLKAFACHKGNVKFLNSIMELSSIAAEMSVELSTKQTKISDFFQRKQQ